MSEQVIHDTQVIIAQGFRGHRLMYVRLLAEAVLGEGRHPLLLLPSGVREQPEFAVHLRDIETSVSLRETDDWTLQNVRRFVEDGSVHPTVFSEGDPWVRSIAWRAGAWPGGISLLQMRGRGQSRRSVQRAAQTLAKSLLRWLVSARSGVSVYVLVSATASKLRRNDVPDPVSVVASPARSAALRASWYRSSGQRVSTWAGIVGGIGSRKNVELVAQALACTSAPIGLVLAGSAEVDELLIAEWVRPLSESGRFVVRNAQSLSEEDFDSTISALDCVVLAHSNEGPSGILAKAFVMGTPVVASGAVSLRADIHSLGTQAEWVPLDRKALAQAIDRAVLKVHVGVSTPDADAFATKLINN